MSPTGRECRRPESLCHRSQPFQTFSRFQQIVDFLRSFFHDPGWVSRDNTVRRHIIDHDASCRNHGAFTQFDTGQDCHICRDPGMVTNFDGRQRRASEIIAVKVMRLRNEKPESREIHVIANLDTAPRQEHIVGANNAVIPYNEIVRQIDAIADPDNAIRTDWHAEQSAINKHAQTVAEKYQFVEPQQIRREPASEPLRK